MNVQQVIGDFVIYKKSIGKGSFSKIYMGKSILNNELVAAQKN